MGAASALAAVVLEHAAQAESVCDSVVPSENPSGAWWLPPSSLTSLRALASRLDELQRAVDGADAAPSPDARAGFALAKSAVEAGLAAWERLSGETLSGLNAELAAAGEPPLARVK